MEFKPPLKKCLVVDDDKSMRDFARIELGRGGFVIEEAENGKVALEKLNRERNFSIVLLDQMMPIMDGLTTLEKIRKSEKLAGVKVIMATAVGTYNMGVEAMKKGANDFIVKPFAPGFLQYTVENVYSEAVIDAMNEKFATIPEDKRDKVQKFKEMATAGFLLKHEVNNQLQLVLLSAGMFDKEMSADEAKSNLEKSVENIRYAVEKFVYAVNLDAGAGIQKSSIGRKEQPN